MTTQFQINAIDYKQFKHLFSLSDEELAALHAKKLVVDAKPGYPCRVSLQESEIGEVVLLLHYQHHTTLSPYRSSGPIFVRENAVLAEPKVNEVPEILQTRSLSIRAYDSLGVMIEAQIVKGMEIKDCLHTIFDDHKIEYVHIHNANPGCFNCIASRV
ncbi:DUF1203 domain-containing protein [Pseudoalteromonas piscicida]|uniref:DUF1203 domain-containing protein n=1 Tax=Pseudoalteromonas piscicida TaxID=43662 RepID=UPI001EFCA4D2|nr:DUF1203 domain-containing protein [Pseudoalteromonas piscicida]MCG9767715.1 DUF1203 domain-containing protein [Pseudoalteromonas piscicida]